MDIINPARRQISSRSVDTRHLKAVMYQMKDENKTREQLMEELQTLRRKVSDLEKSEAEYMSAKAATLQGELDYGTLVENIPQKIFFKDNNSVYVRVNSSFARDFGVSTDDFVGKTDFDFFPGHWQINIGRTTNASCHPVNLRPGMRSTLTEGKPGLSIP